MFDLSRAPFDRRADADCSQVAEEMAACFEVVTTLRNKVTEVVRTSLFAIELALEEPIARAMLTLAAEMDAGVGDGRANPYHNTQHYCEVMLSALYLSTLDGMSTVGRARLLMAALAHDFHHGGRSSIGQSFRLERLAAQATLPYLSGAGVKRKEWGRPMTALDKLAFLEKVFGDFTVSTFFSPNVKKLKEAMHRQAEAIRR